MNRRHFLSTVLSTAGAGWIVRPAFGTGVYEPPEEELVRISIFHTTDLHGHIMPTEMYDGTVDVGGFGRCLTQIRDWRKGSDHSLTVDVGDLYQGTHVSRESEGDWMVKLLNAGNYDAWVAGNHDFDWGEEVFRRAVNGSDMPVLGANLEVQGHRAGDSLHAGGPFRNLQAGIIREVAGIRIGIVGITTPGLPFWLNPSQLGTVRALDPLAETRRAIDSFREQGVDCVIACGHMGLKRGDGDDYANQVNRIISGCPEIDVYIAGHSHRDRPSTMIRDTLFTQAGYFGIWAGRLELTFLRDSKKLIRRDAETVLMDGEVAVDPLVLEIAGDAVDASREKLAASIGRLASRLEEGDYDGTGADSQSLIAAGMVHALAKRGESVDGVLHGAFVRDPIEPGEKTLADAWRWVPYENRIVTATLTGEQLEAVLEEAFTRGFGKRRLVGFTFSADWNSEERFRDVSGIRDRTGAPLDPAKDYRIAFNSYDAQSGGRRMLLLRETILRAAAMTTYHPVDTREALVDFFLEEKSVTAGKIEALTGA